jgi:hypothetical protein
LVEQLLLGCGHDRWLGLLEEVDLR